MGLNSAFKGLISFVTKYFNYRTYFCGALALIPTSQLCVYLVNFCRWSNDDVLAGVDETNHIGGDFCTSDFHAV